MHFVITHCRFESPHVIANEFDYTNKKTSFYKILKCRISSTQKKDVTFHIARNVVMHVKDGQKYMLPINLLLLTNY